MAVRVLARKSSSLSLLPPRGAILQLLRNSTAAAQGDAGSNLEVKNDGGAENASLGRRRRFRAPATQQTFPTGLVDLWSPLGTSRSMRQMMDVVNSMLDPDLFRVGGMPGLAGSLTRPPWDIVERKDAYHLRIDIPGFEKEDLKIHVEGDELVIKAERGGASDDPNNVFEVEKSMNTRMSLPPEAKREEIKAELKNGVLTVLVPKAQVDEDKQRMVVNVS